MSSKFRAVDRNTPYLLPPSVQDWLPDDHLARFVVDIVEPLDLVPCPANKCDYSWPFGPPAALLRLVWNPPHGVVALSGNGNALAGNPNGLAPKTHLFAGQDTRRTGASVRWRREGPVPSVAAAGPAVPRLRHWGLFDPQAEACDLRFGGVPVHCGQHASGPRHDCGLPQAFFKELQGLFVQVLLIARETGLLKLSNVSLDGTKVRALYARRKSTVETVFGIIKETMGFRRFHLRGLEAVRGEWTLTCLAWNLKRMHALG